METQRANRQDLPQIKRPANAGRQSSRTCPRQTSRAPRLANLEGVRVEMARIYHEMKTGKRATEEGSRLVYVLSQIAKVLELTEIERRLIVLEQLTDGKQLPAPTRRA